MLDRTIPFYNLILRCSHPNISTPYFCEDFHLRMYQPGDERSWAKLEYEIGDFASPAEAETYFRSTYLSQTNLAIEKRCIFAVNKANEVVGSCIAWEDKRKDKTVSSLHWLVVSPDYQRKGIGKALCQKVMEIFFESCAFPVYIHTQPWSYAAVLLYVQQGFRLQKTDTFSQYENQFSLAMDTLKNVLSKSQYDELTEHVDP